MAGKWSQIASEISEPIQPQVAQKEPIGKWAGIAQGNKQQSISPGASGSWQEDMTWAETMLSAAKNTPKSGYKYGKNIYESIIHPVRTANGLLKLTETIGQALSLKEPSDPTTIAGTQATQELQRQGIEKLKPFVDELKLRYGSIDRLKETIATDPVGVLADASSILIPAGKLTGLNKATKIGAALEPMNIVRNTALLPLKLIPESIPIRMYQKSVGFANTLSRKKRRAITRTALKNDIMPTAKGLVKLKNQIDDYNSNINDLLNDASKTGHKLDVNRLYYGLDKVRDKFKTISDEPAKYDAAFKTLKRQWETSLEMGVLRTPQQVQQIKQRIYKDLQSFYEKAKASPARVDLRKAVSRNAREMLENIIPEIKKLNVDEGVLLDLWGELESNANRITNKDIFGLGQPIKMSFGGMVGYAVAGEEGAKVGGMLGLAVGIYDIPQVRAKLAIVLDKMTKRGIEYKMTPTIARLVGYHSGEAQTDKEQ